MEERICVVSKEVYAAMLEAMPPDSRAVEFRINASAIVLDSPFGYRLLFTHVDDWGKR